MNDVFWMLVDPADVDQSQTTRALEIFLEKETFRPTNTPCRPRNVPLFSKVLYNVEVNVAMLLDLSHVNDDGPSELLPNISDDLLRDVRRPNYQMVMWPSLFRDFQNLEVFEFLKLSSQPNCQLGDHSFRTFVGRSWTFPQRIRHRQRDQTVRLSVFALPTEVRHFSFPAVSAPPAFATYLDDNPSLEGLRKAGHRLGRLAGVLKSRMG